MTNQEIIEAFVNNPNISGAEKVLKDQILATEKTLNDKRAELNQLAQDLDSKKVELVSLSGQFEGLLTLILNMHAQKANEVSAPSASPTEAPAATQDPA